MEADGTERSRRESAGLAALGLGYVVAGVALFYGLALDSMQVFTGALIAISLLLAVSMVIVVRNEPLVSRENVVISVCVFVAMALFLGLSSLTELPFAVLFGVLVVVGVILPGLILQYGPSM